VGNKDIGDSVRRIMLKMFSDELIKSYSLLGFKKKKNFSKLGCYRLIIGEYLNFLNFILIIIFTNINI